MVMAPNYQVFIRLSPLQTAGAINQIVHVVAVRLVKDLRHFILMGPFPIVATPYFQDASVRI